VVEVAAIGAQIAAALAAAHASGVVHRDVKPGNVLLGDSGIAKLTDFGIARAVGDVTVTQSGSFAGTPAYLAPEVARGKEPTSASDVFSFGATLYDAVEGGPPFPERQNQLALLHLVAEGKVQPPRQAGALTALLTQLLQIDPEARPSMARAVELLAEIAGPSAALSLLAAAAPAQIFSDPAPIYPPPLPPRQGAAGGRASTALAPFPSPRATIASAPTMLARRLPRRAGIIVAALLVVLAGVAVILAVNAQGPSASQTAANRPAGPSSSAAGSPTTQSGPSSSSSGPISWSAAGQLVINFYNSLADPQAAWAMLSANSQRSFGSQSAFQQYWSQFSPVSGAHAYGVTPNADGSVNVPVDVTYSTPAGSQQTHKVLRVIQQDNQLLIDTETQIS
jgi:serine/threonine protein kinase